MTIAFVIVLLLVAIVLFARETLPVDIVTVLVLLALIVARILTPQEAFSGFGNEIVIILGSVFIISGALRESGIVEWLGERLGRSTSRSEGSLLTMLMGSVAAISALMNNTTVTALLLAPVTGLAKQRKQSPSRYLMPLAFASILGGTCTLIGTSTNVAVRGFMVEAGLPPLGFFELTPVGLIIVAAGMAYMVLIGRFQLPNHRLESSLSEDYGLREYLSEIVIQESSPLVGQTLRESDLGKSGFRVLSLHRNHRPQTVRPLTKLEAGDVLVVNGPVESLVKVRETEGIDIRADVKFGDADLSDDDREVLEVIIPPHSEMRGQRLQDLDLPARFGLAVLAVNRHGRRLNKKLKAIRLQSGDLLLVQGPRDMMDSVRASSDFAVIGEPNTTPHRGKKGLMILGFLGLGVLLGALEVIPLSAGLLGAAVATVLTRCMPIHKIYSCVEWRLIVLIAGMTAFGIAMERTGAAEWLASLAVQALEPFGALVVLAGFALLTVFLTQPMSNAAAALVVLPIALSTAEKLGLNGRSFAVAIAFSASVSLIAPFEPASLLVYGPGKYRFVDFLRVGGLLTLILITLVVVLVPIFWPLQ